MNVDARITNGGGGATCAFRRTDADRKPPSRVLTGLLLGDPMPDREARSDALREKLCTKKPAPSTATPKIVAVLRALEQGPRTLVELSADMGVSHSAACDRAAAALVRGFVSRGGETRYGQKYALTDEGRAELEAQAI